MDFAGVEPGMVLGEIGVGDGFLTFLLAERTGEGGKVYANDINESYLKDFKYYLDQKDLENIEIVIGEIEDPLFPEHDLDMVIMADVFHDLEKPISLIENTGKYLKPGGLLVISERDNTKYYDHPSYFPHFMSMEQLLDIMAKTSFELIKVDTSLERDNLFIFKVSKQKEAEVWDNWMAAFRAGMDMVFRLDKDAAVSSTFKRIHWERLLNEFIDNNPDSEEDNEWKAYVNERIVVLNSLSKSKDLYPREQSRKGFRPERHIRSEYVSLDHTELKNIFKRLGFRYSGIIKSGDFENAFEAKALNGNLVVTDEATNLMWHHGGSLELMDYFDARIWIDELNRNEYAGYSDWRLPSVEEAVSLMENKKQGHGLHIDAVFSANQSFIWTGDTVYSGRAWMVNYHSGSVAEGLMVNECYVRPVRTMSSSILHWWTSAAFLPCLQVISGSGSPPNL